MLIRIRMMDGKEIVGIDVAFDNSLNYEAHTFFFHKSHGNLMALIYSPGTKLG